MLNEQAEHHGGCGALDEEGFLYLTDRKNFTIITGGVNVYPAEIEGLLISHDKVADVAVLASRTPNLGKRSWRWCNPSTGAMQR